MLTIHTVREEVSTTYEIKHSVFICHLAEINSYEDGITYIKTISKKYSDATHNCYALLLKDGSQKFSDDGEPQGTAGVPILEKLKKSSLNDVACVVTRYFGGIKLGTGGLAQAYSQSVSDAIDKAVLVTKSLSYVRTITLGYDSYQSFVRLVESFDVPKDIEYEEAVTVRFYYPIDKDESWLAKEKEFFSGEIKSSVCEKKYIKYN